MPLKTHRDDQPSLNLTPMIDIVFLLIIFFMVGTKFTELERQFSAQPPAVADAAPLTAAPQKRIVEVFRDGREVQLAPKEFAVLEVLLRSDGAVVSAEQLLEKAWDENTDPFTNVVRVTVMTLRRKLGEPAVIVTVPGSGYRV